MTLDKILIKLKICKSRDNENKEKISINIENKLTTGIKNLTD